jgi:hypothetical protein
MDSIKNLESKFDVFSECLPAVTGKYFKREGADGEKNTW